jgi:hypothetical protein
MLTSAPLTMQPCSDGLEPTISGRLAPRRVKLGDLISDIVLGFADGLTVPFALTAGLSS